MRPSSLLLMLAGAMIASCIIGGGTAVQAATTQLTLTRPANVPIITPQAAAAKAGTTILLNENFEGTFPGAWSLQGSPHWGLATNRRMSGTKSAYCAQSGTNAVAAPGPYPLNYTGWMIWGPFDLSAATEGRTTYQLWSQFGAGDRVLAGYSRDGSNFSFRIPTPTAGAWNFLETDMAGLATTFLGQPAVYFALLFQSDASGTAEGAYVDDIVISTGPAPQPKPITGVIKDGAGNPVRGVKVAATGNNNWVYTNALGRYSMPLPPGSYTVVPQKPGYRFTPKSRAIKVSMDTPVGNFTAIKRTGDGTVKRWAVIVGVSDFLTLDDLNYCDDDARDMKATLLTGGWVAANIKTFINAQATRAAIRNAISWMVGQADADDICLFYFSSHGTSGTDLAPLDESDNKDEYLCAYNSSNIGTSQIRDDELTQWLAPLATSRYVVMIDACYSGGLGRLAPANFDFGQDLTQGPPPAEINVQDLSHIAAGVVVTACQYTELSQESSGYKNGVFTYHALRGMAAGRADANKNGKYSAEEVYNFAKGPVHKFNPEQTVFLYDGFPGQLDFCDVAASPVAGKTLALTGAAASTAAGGAQISVSLSAAADVSASILNLAGREIAALPPVALQSGLSTLVWNGKSAQGTSVPGGRYLVRLQARDASGQLARCLVGLTR